MTIDAWKIATQVSDDLQDITKHHRKMRCHGGGNEEANISYVPRKKHQAFHTVFGNMTTPQMVKVLNEVWLDPAWQITATKKQFPRTIKMYPYEPAINVGNG